MDYISSVNILRVVSQFTLPLRDKECFSDFLMKKHFLLISFSFHWHFSASGATCQEELLDTLINSTNSMPNVIQLAECSRLTL